MPHTRRHVRQLRLNGCEFYLPNLRSRPPLAPFDVLLFHLVIRYVTYRKLLCSPTAGHATSTFRQSVRLSHNSEVQFWHGTLIPDVAICG